MEDEPGSGIDRNYSGYYSFDMAGVVLTYDGYTSATFVGIFDFDNEYSGNLNYSFGVTNAIKGG